jgi:hypothetical protein
MSTTTDLRVALAYSLSPHSLIFKIRTNGFMQRGADLQYLSAFPGEKELLFPPLTYLRPTDKNRAPLERTHTVGKSTFKFSFIEVEPTIS